MATKILIRRGPAADWTSVNPTLADGELGFETDTKKNKLGDGVTAWNDLPYTLAYQIHGETEKVVAVDADELALVDTQDGNFLKRFTLTSLWAWVITKIAAISTKGTIVDADALVITDSADAGRSKRTTWTNIKASIKTALSIGGSNAMSVDDINDGAVYKRIEAAVADKLNGDTYSLDDLAEGTTYKRVTADAVGAGSKIDFSKTGFLNKTMDNLDDGTTYKRAADATTYASEAAMLGSGAKKGDIAVRSDLGKTYVLTTTDPTQLANWLEIKSAGGATGGPGNYAFFENDQHITVDYTITSGKNAMTAGPIIVDTGITVTVPTGSVWTII